MYVIFYNDEYDYGFYGVFDTKEKAIEAITKDWEETDNGKYWSLKEVLDMYTIEYYEKNKFYA
jgi:hypothetical protein